MAKLKSSPVVAVAAPVRMVTLAELAAAGISVSDIPTAPVAAEAPARTWAEAEPNKNASEAGYPMGGFASATRRGNGFTLSIPQDLANFIWAEGAAGRKLKFPRAK